jgi:hypothetical protein
MNTTLHDSQIEAAAPLVASLGERRTIVHFVSILSVFTAIYLLSWPILFSLDLWILKDRGSFLQLDYLLDKHLRLGVDTFYSYGLLPVSIQHGLFLLFGRGYWPLIGCAIATTILMALFWAGFLQHLRKEWIWLAAILAMAWTLNTVNPNLPYSLVQLSLLFALLFVLLGQLDISLAISAIGCWSVPSLPLVMTALLAAVIFLDWFVQRPRSIVSLLRQLAPGVVTYAAIGILLACEFGWKSVFATATPLAGMNFYKQVHYAAGQGLMEFLHPWGYHGFHYIAYILITPVSWWIMSSVSLIVFGILAIRRMVNLRALDRRDTAIVLCALIQGVFACFAYGAPHQHYIFDPVLIAGVLLGLSAMSQGIASNFLIALFLVLGISGQLILAHTDWKAWKGLKSPTATANLYADRGWVAEWKNILEISTRKDVLLFSYSTGAHHYFSTIHSPETWTLQEGELLPTDKDRVIKQLDTADVVVLDLTSPTDLVDMDADIRQQIDSMCLEQSTTFFQIWWKRSPEASGLQCIADPRHSHK